MRIGCGYDVHKLVSGRKLILGGIEIPFDKGLSGHSAADVLTHAVMDALLGAAGLRDIGIQFPPEDPRYKDISSLALLDEVNRLLWEKGFITVNIDTVIIAQEPKMMPFIDDMRQQISQKLGVYAEQVMVKATTTDGLGFVGKGEGIAAYAVVMIDSKQI
jgi:2-C-methyl-D-erythritol 2,4-cyclodiphosphate synthase